jgi:hypothetical protein
MQYLLKNNIVHMYLQQNGVKISMQKYIYLFLQIKRLWHLTWIQCSCLKHFFSELKKYKFDDKTMSSSRDS